MNPTLLLEEARQLSETLVRTRRTLHGMPGTAFDLAETVAYVQQELTDMGYAPQSCGRAGLVATVGGQKPGKVFLLRADMDALPMRELADVPFAAQNGCMHACGHDMHTAMLLGAARLLKAHEAEISGTVKLMFQPAEEIFEGSQDMIEAGVLENPAVDAALMIHVAAGTGMPTGSVVVSKPGVSAPAADYFDIRVQGKGCHGSMPEAGIDPITAAAHIVLALQEIAARELSQNNRAVLTIGKVEAGTASNVIPDTALLGGTLRTYDEDTRRQVKTRMAEIVRSVGAAFRTEAEVVFGSGCPTLQNNADLVDAVEGYLTELLGETYVYSQAKLGFSGGGSEDFAYVSQKVPALMLSLAAGDPGDGYVYPQHHPKVMFDESALAPGSAVYAYTALRWLESHS